MYTDDFRYERNKRACDALLDLLCQYHPEQCPSAVRQRRAESKVQPCEIKADAAPIEPEQPSEDDRIAEWIERQKQLSPAWRAWNMHVAHPTAAMIQNAVAKHFSVKKMDMLSVRRTRNVVVPRMVAIHLTRELTPYSLPEIGRRYGGRDHTTILNSLKIMGKRIASDPAFASVVEQLKQTIEREHNGRDASSQVPALEGRA